MSLYLLERNVTICNSHLRQWCSASERGVLLEAVGGRRPQHYVNLHDAGLADEARRDSFLGLRAGDKADNGGDHVGVTAVLHVHPCLGRI